MFNDQLLAGRRILVTGGGTSLGKSMASRFLQLGAEVHICGRRKSVCDETATELMAEYGGRVVSHGVDIRNSMAVDEMIESIWTTSGPVHFEGKFHAISGAHVRPKPVQKPYPKFYLGGG